MKVKAGNVAIGGGAPISVQTMTTTDTKNAEATISQIRVLEEAGADYIIDDMVKLFEILE